MKTDSSRAFLLTEQVCSSVKNNHCVLKVFSEDLYEHVYKSSHTLLHGVYSTFPLLWITEGNSLKVWPAFCWVQSQSSWKKKIIKICTNFTWEQQKEDTRRTLPCFCNLQLNRKHRLWEVAFPISKSQDRCHNITECQLSTLSREEYQQMTDHLQQRMEKRDER